MSLWAWAALGAAFAGAVFGSLAATLASAGARGTGFAGWWATALAGAAYATGGRWARTAATGAGATGRSAGATVRSAPGTGATGAGWGAGDCALMTTGMATASCPTAAAEAVCVLPARAGSTNDAVASTIESASPRASTDEARPAKTPIATSAAAQIAVGRPGVRGRGVMTVPARDGAHRATGGIESGESG